MKAAKKNGVSSWKKVCGKVVLVIFAKLRQKGTAPMAARIIVPKRMAMIVFPRMRKNFCVRLGVFVAIEIVLSNISRHVGMGRLICVGSSHKKASYSILGNHSPKSLHLNL